MQNFFGGEQSALWIMWKCRIQFHTIKKLSLPRSSGDVVLTAVILISRKRRVYKHESPTTNINFSQANFHLLHSAAAFTRICVVQVKRRCNNSASEYDSPSKKTIYCVFI